MHYFVCRKYAQRLPLMSALSSPYERAAHWIYWPWLTPWPAQSAQLLSLFWIAKQKKRAAPTVGAAPNSVSLNPVSQMDKMRLKENAMSVNTMFKEQLQAWLDFLKWSKADLARALERKQDRKNLRSKVDTWLNRGVFPDENSFESLLSVLNIDKDTFFRGPSYFVVPYQQALTTQTKGNILYRGIDHPSPLNNPIDTGFVFREFLFLL